MAIAYVSSTSQTGDFVSSLTKALDVGTADDRVLLVFACTDRGSATTISSATYNGVSMTAHTAFTSTLSNIDGRLFYLAAPTSGSNSIVVTYSDGNTKPKFLAAAYSGVDGTTPVDQLTNYSANTSAPTATISSASGDMVIFMGAYINRTAIAPSSPAVEQFDAVMGTGVYGFLFEEAGDTSVTIDGTVSGGAAEVWATALNLNAAGGGATGVPATNRFMMGVG